MIAPIVINRTTVKGGAGMPTSEYAQLVYKGEEIGFISEQGIFLKMWHPELKAGVFQTSTLSTISLSLRNANLSKRTGMPSMTVILLSSEENEFSLLCFHILIYCLTTGKSGAENSALLVETCEQSPCRKQPS